MAVKKKVKKSSRKSVKTKRISSKKSVKRKSSRVVSSKRKFDLVLKNLVVFVLLSLVSVGLYNVFTDEILVNFFGIVALITGFVAVALLISWLLLFFMKSFKK